MPEMVEFYNTHKDFKEYVDKFAAKHRMLPEVALGHKLIFDVYVYYKHDSRKLQHT